MARTIRRSVKRQVEKRHASGGGKFLPPDELLTFTFYLRHRQPVRRRPGSAIDLAELAQRITREDLEAERKRILKRPIEHISRFAKREGMRLVAVDIAARCITFAAKASDAERVFATRLLRFDDAGAQRHHPSGKVRMPHQLARLVHTVVGLDTRPPRGDGLRNHAVASGGNGLQPSQMAGLHRLTTPGRGAGGWIADLEPPRRPGPKGE